MAGVGRPHHRRGGVYPGAVDARLVDEPQPDRRTHGDGRYRIPSLGDDGPGFERDMDAEAKRNQKSWLETIADWMFDPPPQAQRDFYEAGRRVFIADMRAVIEDVADVVGTGLSDARKIVEDGKTQVQEKLDILGGDLSPLAFR